MNDDNKVAEAFGLDAKALAGGAIVQAPNLKVATVAPEPSPKAKKPRKAPKAKAKAKAAKPVNGPRKPAKRLRRTDSKVFDVTAKATGKHADLLGVYGYLTIDYHGDTPFYMTFDPGDEDILNQESGIVTMMRSDRTFVIRDDEETTWRFAVEEDDEDEDDTDYSHPFNRD